MTCYRCDPEQPPEDIDGALEAWYGDICDDCDDVIRAALDAERIGEIPSAFAYPTNALEE